MEKPSRPYMPGYGIRKDEKGLLTCVKVENGMLAARNYCFVGVRPDGRPHCVPEWGLWHAGTFYFAIEKRSQKARNINNNVEVAVHLESGDDVVILEGKARRVEQKGLLNNLNSLYRQKYDFPILGDALTFGLRPDLAYAWKETDFPNSATRWRSRLG